MKVFHLLILFLIGISFELVEVAGDYAAAVVNHDVYLGNSQDSPQFLLDVNIELYENLTALAALNQAQVIVFPEFGLTPVEPTSREDVYPFIENIPESDEDAIPCLEAETFNDRPILYRMSCAARNHGILTMVNMIDKQVCSKADSNCPDDGHYQYNTDVVFDESGIIVAKYHKTHEWIPLLKVYNQPSTSSHITYKSNKLGVTFGLFICFDIMFPDPAKVLVDQGIQHFMYAVQQAYIGDATIIKRWSDTNHAVVLAANANFGGRNGTIGNFSRVFVDGNVIRGEKYSLMINEFSYENIEIVSVPT